MSSNKKPFEAQINKLHVIQEELRLMDMMHKDEKDQTRANCIEMELIEVEDMLCELVLKLRRVQSLVLNSNVEV